jgi:hypothetical protein
MISYEELFHLNMADDQTEMKILTSEEAEDSGGCTF